MAIKHVIPIYRKALSQQTGALSPGFLGEISSGIRLVSSQQQHERSKPYELPLEDEECDSDTGMKMTLICCRLGNEVRGHSQYVFSHNLSAHR